MGSQSLLFDEKIWSFFRLGERAWLLQCSEEEGALNKVHEAGKLIEEANFKNLIDIIPAYDSITLIFNHPSSDLGEILTRLKHQKLPPLKQDEKSYIIPVCYELGLDWEEMESETGLKKEEIIRIHSSKEYKVAMTGFVPGFLFLSGLDNRISVSRKQTPRTSVPSGSIGIGGSQTGLYSLESPGGWQIIGRSHRSFFSIDENPPMKIRAGDTVVFKPVSEKEFNLMRLKNE